METPHPHRISAAGNIRHPLHFGHNGTPLMFDATAATVRFDVGGFRARPSAAVHDHPVTLCNHLHRRNQLVQRPMFA